MQWAKDDPDGFWAEQAKSLHWFKPWNKVLEWNEPLAKWFVGGKINASYNCLDRHLTGPRKNKTAIIWEGEPGDTRVLTYQELHREVCKFANVLKQLGIQKGDRVTIYMPMIPEAAIAMLACARIGATHSVDLRRLLGRGRRRPQQRRRLETRHHRRRRLAARQGRAAQGERRCSAGQVADRRRSASSSIAATRQVDMKAGRDFWWHDVDGEGRRRLPRRAARQRASAVHPLHLRLDRQAEGHAAHDRRLPARRVADAQVGLRPEGRRHLLVYRRHRLGDGAQLHRLRPAGQRRDASSCTKALRIIRKEDRFWEIIEKYKVTIFYTAPTAIRAFVKWGDQWPKGHDLSSLRLLGTVGEPINPEAWMWYHEVIGGGRCPIVDTWWQTETGAIMIAPLPGAIATKPGSATRPLPGIDAEIVDKQGNPVPAGSGGLLVIRRPWPSMLRTIYGDDERYKQQYWSQVAGCYFTADGSRRDEDGYFWIMGRVDDVLNVAGHRLSTMEVESALVHHPKVAEAAVVGQPDDIKGEAIACFVTLEAGHRADRRT